RRHTRFSRDWSSDVCSSDLSFHGRHAHLANIGRDGGFGMKRAKILHDGRAQWGEVIEHDTLIRLRDGICIAAEHARWLPPITPGATIFALGLNYADHSAELGFKAPTSPLVFLKGHGT